MDSEIATQLKRLVGENAVRLSQVPTEEAANRRVRLETANAVYDLPENRLLILLRELPDRIGVEALRKVLEDSFPSART